MADRIMEEARRIYQYARYSNHLSEEIIPAISVAIRDAENDALERCRALCQLAADAYDNGAGSAHSEEARNIGKAQAIWLRDEIARLSK